MRKFDQTLFLDEVSEAFKNSDMDWNTWYQNFNRICDKHAPVCKQRINPSKSPWIDEDVAQLMYARDHAKNMSDKTDEPGWGPLFISLKKQCRILTKLKKIQFFEDNTKLKYTDPRKFWKNMSRFMPKFNPKSIPKSMTEDHFN